MSAFLTALGIVLLAISLIDVFQTLFHPASHGTMSDFLAKFVWKVFRRIAQIHVHLLTLAGSFAMFTIILSWAVLIILGCALIYYPRIFVFSPFASLTTPHPSAFFDAWNISLGSLITATAETTQNHEWMHLLMNLEGVIGFGLVTASVSWLLSIYPILEARRTLAREAHSLDVARRESGTDVLDMPDSDAQGILMNLSRSLCSIRNQTAQFPITYYFTVRETDGELASVMPFIADLAARASERTRPFAVQFAGCVLEEQVRSYLELLAFSFLEMKTDSRELLLQAYQSDHLHN